MPISDLAAQGIMTGAQQAGNFLSEAFFNKRRKQESELQYQRQVDFWNMQNQYNSPASQMARYKEAGLNPNLIYGQGNPGNASQTPQYNPPQLHAPKMDPINILGMMSSIEDIKNKKVQNDVLTQQAKAIEQRRLNDGIENSIKALRLQSNAMDYQFKGQAFDYNLEALKYKNLTSQQYLLNLGEMNKKIKQDILTGEQNVLYSKSATALNWDKHKYAKEGLNLRTPGGLEQALTNFLEGFSGGGIGTNLNRFGKWSSKKLPGYFKYTSPFAWIMSSYGNEW